MNNSLLFALIFCAVVMEGIITYTKTFFVDNKPQWQMLVGIALGVLVAVAYRLDLFALAGMTPSVRGLSWLGCALTGVLLSRGSNYIFDLVKLIGELTTRFKPHDPPSAEMEEEQ